MEIEIKEEWMAIICINMGLLILVFPDLLRWLAGVSLLLVGIGYLLRSNIWKSR